MFAGFSYNGHSTLSGGSGAASANNSAVLSAPPSPSPIKRPAGGPSTPLLLPVGSPGRSSRDKSVDKSLLPQLGLLSSNGYVSSVRAGGDKI